MNEELIEILQRALALEYAGVMVYNRFAATIQGVERASLGEVFAESATESLAHASVVMQWMIYLSEDVQDVEIMLGDMNVPVNSAPRNGDTALYLKWAINHESHAVKVYSDALNIVDDPAVQDWLQEQVQAETKDLIEFRLLATKY